MSNNSENVRESNNSTLGTIGQIVGRFIAAAIVLAITAFFTPGFTRVYI